MGALEVAKAEQLCPDQPWNVRNNIDMLGPTIMKWMEDLEPFYKRWAEQWFNNFQFIYGNQAVRWSRKYGYAVDVDYLQRLPAMNQRAQTNLARVVAESLSSMIFANLPEWNVETAERSSIAGKRMKRIIQKILDAYMIRLCCDIEFQAAAMIYTVFGMFGAQIDWNQTGGSLMEIPRWKKQRAPVMTDFMPTLAMQPIGIPTGALDANGQPMFEERWEPVLDQMGKQIVDKFFAGDVRLDILTPFEYRRRIDSRGPHKSSVWQRTLLLDYDEYLDRYGYLPGRTKYFERVQPVYSNPAVYRLAVRHFMRMQYTTPPGLNDLYNRPQNVYRSSMFRNKVLVVEHYDAPHPIKWPLGRKVVVCNGDATHVTVPDYNTGKMGGWHPFIESQWLNIPPSPMAAGPLNDVVAKNRELNVIDSLYATMIRRNCGSQLLIKTGSGIDPQRITGEPGMTHEVPDPYGARWLHDDMPIPMSLPPIRQSIKEDVFDVSGAGEALRGERSPGAPSGYAQQIILEREESRLSPARKNFEAGCSGIGEKIWCCLKTKVIKLDDNVMGYLQRAAAGEFQPSDVMAMLGGKAAFGVEIVVETDSMHLRSRATQQATMADLAQNNAAVSQRLQQNPGVLDNFLEFFGADKLRDKSASHRDRAQRENEQYSDLLHLGGEALSTGLPVVLEEDDDSIHIDEHTDFLIQNSDEITRNPAFFQVIKTHINRHIIQMNEKQGNAAPGTSIQTPALMALAQKQPPPTVQTIFQTASMEQQQQQMQQQQAQKKGGGAGPTQAPPPGQPGPSRQMPGTPAPQQRAGKQQVAQGKVKPR
jgi:hypothetical protein